MVTGPTTEPKERVILELCLFRHGVKLFEDRVNAALASGWKIKETDGIIEMDVRKHGWFRTMCEAVLVIDQVEDARCNPSK